MAGVSVLQSSVWLLPSLVAHRGAGFLAPENTLTAFVTAKEFGCRAVEFDVQLTADGVLVLSHDLELGRVIDGIGFVGELSSADLKLLRVKNPHQPQQDSALVCFLQEAVEVCSILRLAMNVELKPVSGREAELAERVAVFLRKAKVDVPLLVSSFSTKCLVELRKRSPETPCGFLFEEPECDWLTAANAIQARTVHPHKDLVTPEMIETAHKHGLGVMAWTVDDVEEAKALIKIGADAICTNRPDILKTIF